MCSKRCHVENYIQHHPRLQDVPECSLAMADRSLTRKRLAGTVGHRTLLRRPLVITQIARVPMLSSYFMIDD